VRRNNEEKKGFSPGGRRENPVNFFGEVLLESEKRRGGRISLKLLEKK